MDESASSAKADGKKKPVQNSMSAVLQMLNNPGGADSESSNSGDSESSNSGSNFPATVTPVAPVVPSVSIVVPPTSNADNVIAIPVSEVTLTPDQFSQIEAALLTSEEGQKILETFSDPASYIVEDILEQQPSAICIPAQELDSISLQHTVAISTAASTDPKLPIRTANDEDSNEPGYGFGFAEDHSYCSTALDQLEHESTSATGEAQVRY